MSCSDVIYIIAVTHCHVVVVICVNKNGVKCGNQTILRSRLFRLMHNATQHLEACISLMLHCCNTVYLQHGAIYCIQNDVTVNPRTFCWQWMTRDHHTLAR